MEITDVKCVSGFLRMCDDGWKQGWHERNGGNLSYRMDAQDIESVLQFCPPESAGQWSDIGIEAAALCGAWFMITGAGKFFQNCLRDPADSVGIIELDETGTRWRRRWGFSGGVGAGPSSELPSHILNHAVKLEATGGRSRVLYHCHPANLIALTFVLPLKDDVFTRELWQTMTECPIIFPAGVGVLPWMVPGGRDIALASCEKMKKYDVLVWAHHGVFCFGDSFDLAFGLTHAVEKAAEILVKIRSMAPERGQTISKQDLRRLAEAFDLELADV